MKGAVVHAMLRPQQYQLLQIDTPPVKPEELRAAARFQIRDLVNAHIDDMTLDVMQVGDGQHKSGNHLFVVAARNEVIREVLDLGDALSWQVPVIDVQDMAQRNLQALAARDADRLARAEALLLISDAEHALLTITANEELFFTRRRIDLPPGFWRPAGTSCCRRIRYPGECIYARGRVRAGIRGRWRLRARWRACGQRYRSVAAPGGRGSAFAGSVGPHLDQLAAGGLSPARARSQRCDGRVARPRARANCWHSGAGQPLCGPGLRQPRRPGLLFAPAGVLLRDETRKL